MAGIDETTQQNAALVEQAAAAAESLQEQSGALLSAVARFQLSSAANAMSGATAGALGTDVHRGVDRPASMASRPGPKNRPAARLVPAAGRGAAAEAQDEWAEF